MSSFQTVATIRKNNAEEIRVSVAKLDGFTMVDVRTFSSPSASGAEPRPTKKGICIPHTKLRDLVAALQAVEKDVSR